MIDNEYAKRRMRLAELEDSRPAKHECLRGALRNGKPTRTEIKFRSEAERQQLIGINEIAEKAGRCGRIHRHRVAHGEERFSC